MAIQFAQLEDFHPDELHQNLELFQALRELRARLMNPTTLPQAAAELRNDALKTIIGVTPKPVINRQKHTLT